MKLGERFHRFLSKPGPGKWAVLCTLIGVIAGLGAVLFQVLSQAVMGGFLARTTGYVPGEPSGEHHWISAIEGPEGFWFIPLVMALGGLVSGCLVYIFAPEAEGHGTDSAIDAFHNNGGQIPTRIPWIKMLASSITLGTGGSGGREGPIAQIGAGFGSLLGTRLRLSVRDRRILMAAGMGAGVAAIFRAPLAGALFASEILYSTSDLETEALIPAAIASMVAFTTYSLFLPSHLQFVPLFGIKLDFSLSSFRELLPLTLMALALCVAGFSFTRMFYGAHDLFKKLPCPPHFRPMIGAGAAGLFALGLYSLMAHDPQVLAVLSTGYGALQNTLDGTAGMSILLLVTIAIGKIVTTSLTIGSGGSSGVFGPSMVIGGCIGGACGLAFQALWPGWVSEPRVYVIIGMAGFFAGSANAPISTIIMVWEMTGQQRLLLPTMWVSLVCYLICRKNMLYRSQCPTRFESPAHRGEFVVDVLAGIRVEELMPEIQARYPDTVTEDTTLDRIVHLLSETRHNYFPVMDAENSMVGIFSSNDVRSYLYDESIWQLTVAQDIMVPHVLSVTPEDDLGVAFRRFTRRNIDELPVVSPEDHRKVIGMLSRKDAIAVYNEKVLESMQRQNDD